MVEGRCSICGEPLVKLRHIPSALDDIKTCPKCGCSEIGFFIPQELGSCVVNCLCGACGHKWDVNIVLPKNLLGKK